MHFMSSLLLSVYLGLLQLPLSECAARQCLLLVLMAAWTAGLGVTHSRSLVVILLCIGASILPRACATLLVRFLLGMHEPSAHLASHHLGGWNDEIRASCQSHVQQSPEAMFIRPHSCRQRQ